MGLPRRELNTAISDSDDLPPPPPSCAGHSVSKKPGELQQLAVGDAEFHSIWSTVGNFCMKRVTIKLAEKFPIP